MRKTIRNKKFKLVKLYYEGTPATKICQEYRVAHSTLYKWINDYPEQAILEKSMPHRSITKLFSHTKKMEAELAFLQRTVIKDISLRERMAVIDKEYGKESLHVQCEALNVNRSTYLNHKYRNKNDDTWFKKREAEYTELIADIYEQSGHVYGARKIAAIMRARGKSVSSKFVRRIMSESGFVSARSSADKSYQLVARHLREAAHSSQEFNVNGINQVWVSDTTAVSVNNRYYYICAYIDLFSRKIVGWGIGRNNSTQLAKRTFLKAYENRRPKSLIVHTDNGTCYTSYSFNQTLLRCGVDHSYSRMHIPHDNAVAESFFSTLKREGIFLNGYPTSLRKLREHVEAYMEKYNSLRPHEHLNHIAPDEFEQKCNQFQKVDKTDK